MQIASAYRQNQSFNRTITKCTSLGPLWGGYVNFTIKRSVKLCTRFNAYPKRCKIEVFLSKSDLVGWRLEWKTSFGINFWSTWRVVNSEPDLNQLLRSQSELPNECLLDHFHPIIPIKPNYLSTDKTLKIGYLLILKFNIFTSEA